MAPDPKDAQKVKTEELEETPMPEAPPSSGPPGFPLNTTPQPPSIALQLNTNSQLYPNALRQIDSALLSAPRIFPSPTALEESSDSISEIIKENDERIARAVDSHSYQLKHTLEQMHQRHTASIMKAAQENFAKKLKEKETQLLQMTCRTSELEGRLERTTMELQLCSINTKQMEARWTSLQSCWQNFMSKRANRIAAQAAGCSAPVQQDEENQSSHVDTNAVEPVRLTCKVCSQKVGTLMIWQCHHLCVCKSCDEHTSICPICQATKTSSKEVHLE